MSDSQKATLSLTLALETCNNALTALLEPDDDSEDYPTAEFTTLRTDFISILSIIHSAATKVALSLKPTSPQHKAALVPLRDLTNNVAALVHSIRLMRRKQSLTLMKEYESVAENVISAIRSLVQSLLSPPVGQSLSSKEYLVRTGEVHEIIDRVRKPGGLSLSNRDAVQKIWLQDHDSLQDGAEEIKEMCKPGNSNTENGDEDGDAFCDGWEELGVDSNQKLSLDELDRAEKVEALVKVTLLLHKRVINDVLSSKSQGKDDVSLNKLAVLSGSLLTASDDLISSMYSPQHLDNITSCLRSFLGVNQDIRKIILLPHEKALEERMDGLSLADHPSEKTRKWFTTCFDQIDKCGAKVLATLTTANNLR
ncbi:hypothetical protein M413DRAFT_96652 [Hebeloma cylindrosporum]|uniref:Uncharacterized protein n=1 Tax=Hebeloma cylindrosporum TaxID=76867 RepID=A0A0C3CZ82_HEBCY|nr:hypothetical protein M413DRAFT_96652 [Hebeloma cylindrosporum h7]